MGVFLIICIIANYVCCYFAAQYFEGKNGDQKNNNKGNIFFVSSIVLSILAAVLLIKVIDSGNHGMAVGQYNYYINGKKVSSTTYSATQNFGIGFTFFIILFGSGMALAANIIKKKNSPKVKKEDKKPNVVALVFSIISVFFGFILTLTSFLALTNTLQKNSESAPYFSLVLAIVFIVFGIRGIMVYRNRKKK